MHGLMLTQNLSSPFIFMASVKVHMSFFSSVFFQLIVLKWHRRTLALGTDFQVLSGLFIQKHDLNFVQGITHFFSEEIEEDLVTDLFANFWFYKPIENSVNDDIVVDLAVSTGVTPV